jgi:glutamate-ammonia-ligase adenylyltransferase
MGSAPLLAEMVSRSPVLLDGVLSAGFFDAVPDREHLQQDLQRQLAMGNDFQDRLDILRRWTKDLQFQIGVRLLHSGAYIDAAANDLSDVADTAIGALLPLVTEEFARQHGTLKGDGLAVIALGKLGSREMTITSDLDLVFIYDIPKDAEDWESRPSDGAKPLAPIQYYARLAQRFINAMTAMTGEGKLFDVDMRLRPSGNSGPIASGLTSFERYQCEEAWTWEHMALTRARVVAGKPDMQLRVEAALRRILARPRDPAKLRNDIVEMRQRILQQYRGDNPWDLNHYRGGQVDVDFAAQYIQLREAHAHPQLLHRRPVDCLKTARRLKLIEPGMADDLIIAGTLWNRLQQMIRLMVAGRVDNARLPPPTQHHLAMVAGCPDFPALQAEIEARAQAALQAVTSLLSD